jgi:hypothetical protein
MSSPTKRTMDELNAMGFTAHVVEKRLPHCLITVDCFGFGDILAMREGFGIVLIQTTSAVNHNARKYKTIALEETKLWLLCGGRVEIWSWANLRSKLLTKKKFKNGKFKPSKRRVWVLRREEVTADMCGGDIGLDLAQKMVGTEARAA